MLSQAAASGESSAVFPASTVPINHFAAGQTRGAAPALSAMYEDEMRVKFAFSDTGQYCFGFTWNSVVRPSFWLWAYFIVNGRRDAVTLMRRCAVACAQARM